MKYKIFIDGSEGTTGLRIADRIAGRREFEPIRLPEELRKNEKARREAINSSDVTILCLPDAAAREAVRLAENERVKIIDASSAHRTESGWVYGFAELSEKRRAEIAAAKRVANPGCHASGFIAITAPLVRAGAIDRSARTVCFSLTGYSGGGKKMIAGYEAADRPAEYCGGRLYGLDQRHKHLNEMTKETGLEHPPTFCPVVEPFYSGMAVTVAVGGHTPDEIYEILSAHYADSKLIGVARADGFLSAAALSGFDDMKIYVGGADGRVTATAVFDNLGKGASGAAIQNMNIMLGVAETTGLITE